MKPAVRPRYLLLCVLLFLACACQRENLAAVPASGKPAARIVTLAPHLAELVDSIGAGDRIVGVSAHTDFSEGITDLPQVGDAFLVDQERLALLEPDLILAWQSGTPASTVEELRRRGYRVEVIRTQRLADVAAALLEVGRLTGEVEQSRAAARAFEQELGAIGRRYAASERVRVFYQVSERPLYTVSGAHFVSELIDLCGGRNVFSDLNDLAPMVSEEAVLARDPEMFLAGGTPGGTDHDPFAVWRRWDAMAANRYDNFFVVDANTLARPTTRLVEAGKQICERLQRGRINRRAVNEDMTSAAR